MVATIDPVLVAKNAQKVLLGNHQQGISEWGGKPYSFVCPSPNNYPFQWFWDSAFHAIALLHVDPELSKQEIRCMLQAAQPDGFIPHMILWGKNYHQKALKNYSIVLADPFYTATIQPPVLARSILRIYEATKDKQFLSEVLPQTIAFFNWLKTYRDPDCDCLISIIQPDESGLDASPKYDVLMHLEQVPTKQMDIKLKDQMQRLFKSYATYRNSPKDLLGLDIFNWEDVMVNTIYADGLSCLGKLCHSIGYPKIQALEFEREAQGVVKALQEKCWDEKRGVFWDLYGSDEKQAKILTFSSIFPIVNNQLDSSVLKRLVEEHLLNEKEFWLPYPIPSVAASEPSFDPNFSTKTIWRGPSSVNINWYIWQRLKEEPEYKGIASELAKRTIAMVSKGGFREFFNPQIARGLGATDFGWTTLVLDMIHDENLGCACPLKASST